MKEILDTWLAIVNPAAGSGKTLAKWRTAEPLLFQHGINYEFETPETKTGSIKLITKACSEGYRKFIAVGGDGTVHNILSTIVEYIDKTNAGNPEEKISLSQFYLAVLPIGSGNDWLKSHNIPAQHPTIIDMISKGSFAPQDIVRAEIIDPNTGKTTKRAYMANVGGYSFDANVCDIVNFQKTKGITGKMLYVNALKKLALVQKPFPTRILCDGKEVYDDMVYSISFGNGRYSGGGLRQTPSAVMDDGLLDMMLVPKIPIWKVFLNIGKLLNGRAESIRFLHFHKAKQIEVIPHGQGQLVEIDGDVIGRAPLKLTVLEEQINVLDAQDAKDRARS